MKIFQKILLTQWLWARAGLIPLTIVSFALPIFSVQGATDAQMAGFRIRSLVSSVAQGASGYPLLATIIGLLLGITAWSADHRTRHVYALALPIKRSRFALQRAGAGLALLSVPCAAMWIACLAAASAAEIPILLQTYPNAIAFRFFLATLLGFAVFFAVGSGTSKTAGIILGLGALVPLTQLLLRLFGVSIDLIGPSLDIFTGWPGPFEIFRGPWLLIDY